MTPVKFRLLKRSPRGDYTGKESDWLCGEISQPSISAVNWYTANTNDSVKWVINFHCYDQKKLEDFNVVQLPNGETYKIDRLTSYGTIVPFLRLEVG